jgi:hypothetical protein
VKYYPSERYPVREKKKFTTAPHVFITLTVLDCIAET